MGVHKLFVDTTVSCMANERHGAPIGISPTLSSLSAALDKCKVGSGPNKEDVVAEHGKKQPVRRISTPPPLSPSVLPTPDTKRVQKRSAKKPCDKKQSKKNGPAKNGPAKKGPGKKGPAKKGPGEKSPSKKGSIVKDVERPEALHPAVTCSAVAEESDTVNNKYLLPSDLVPPSRQRGGATVFCCDQITMKSKGEPWGDDFLIHHFFQRVKSQHTSIPTFETWRDQVLAVQDKGRVLIRLRKISTEPLEERYFTCNYTIMELAVDTSARQSVVSNCLPRGNHVRRYECPKHPGVIYKCQVVGVNPNDVKIDRDLLKVDVCNSVKKRKVAVVDAESLRIEDKKKARRGKVSEAWR